MPNKTRAFLLQRNDIFYFIRRIPDQLQHHYRTGRICFSLKTKSKNIALLRSRELALRLENHWFHLRMRDDAVFGRFLNQPIFTPLAENAVKVPEAVGQFLANGLFKLCDFKHPLMQHR